MPNASMVQDRAEILMKITDGRTKASPVNNQFTEELDPALLNNLTRFAAIGEMCSDIAHELNNYLLIICGNLQLLPLYLEDRNEAKLKRNSEMVINQIDNISTLIQGLQSLTTSPKDPTYFNINSMIEAIVHFLQLQNRFDNTTIELKLQESIPRYMGRPQEIQQCLLAVLRLCSVNAEEDPDLKALMKISTQLEGDVIVLRVSTSFVRRHKKLSIASKREHACSNLDRFYLSSCRSIIEANDGEFRYSRNGDGKCDAAISLPVQVSEPLTRIL